MKTTAAKNTAIINTRRKQKLSSCLKGKHEYITVLVPSINFDFSKRVKCAWCGILKGDVNAN